MSTDNQASLRVLQQRLDTAQEALERVAPKEFAEYELYRKLVEQRKAEATTESAPYLNRQAALLALLEERNQWMSIAELTDEMEKMGLVAGKAQRGAVNTLINYNVEKKTIQKWGQGNSTEVLIGMPGWDTPEEEQY